MRNRLGGFILAIVLLVGMGFMLIAADKMGQALQHKRLSTGCTTIQSCMKGE